MTGGAITQDHGGDNSLLQIINSTIINNTAINYGGYAQGGGLNIFFFVSSIKIVS